VFGMGLGEGPARPWRDAVEGDSTGESDASRFKIGMGYLWTMAI
jgi:hypothetical protein